ncbi:restriction endonuclease subunit S [Aeromonas caviae]|uniref:restriction endonuclease subunit S n=1 Tax=Aeromonas caviae TaxID=648 RepID=UPI000DE832F4|nr:restriction endonuclease subunit S [Aeromonas caviae]RCE16965.1 type I restriction endonuclease subunit S [Aeromonas caviae]
MAIESLITDHLALWIAAVRPKSSAGRGSNSKLELTGIKKLRELILELAVRGKLIPQDPSDEPASVLLERIAAEKTRLVKEGKIKKPKALPEISEEDKPFELPGEWQWSRLQELTSYIQRGKGPDYADAGTVKVISQKCIQWSGFDASQARFISDSSINGYQNERFLQLNDLLWNSTGTGTVGRVNVLDSLPAEKIVADSHVTVIRPLEIDCNFLWCYIAAPGIQSRIEPSHEKSLVSGSTKQVELSTSTVSSLVIPVPPLSEQHRIVAKVDELMVLCDQLEQSSEAQLMAHQTLVDTLLGTLTDSGGVDDLAKNWARLSTHFYTLFTTEASIDALKQTVLQLAVMGKLVPQDLSDEPASTLLERITAEKEKLVKEGKIKKQKQLPVLTEEEKPFELPRGWEWTRLGNIGICSTGKTPSTGNAAFYDGEIPFVGPGQITPYGTLLEAEKCLSDVGLDLSAEAITGDILMVCIGGSIGKAAICNRQIGFNQQINSIRPILCDSYFLLAAMTTKAFTNILLERATGSATPIINRSKWEEIPIPMSPYQEQLRIISRVNELMTLCDQLKSSLQTSQQTQLALAESLVEGALEGCI